MPSPSFPKSFSDPMAPLTACAPYTVLQHVFQKHGDLCSPPTGDDDELPAGWCRLTIDCITRYYTIETLQDFADELARVLKAHTIQPPADTDPTA